jgi:hypothetical protein
MTLASATFPGAIGISKDEKIRAALEQTEPKPQVEGEIGMEFAR